MQWIQSIFMSIAAFFGGSTAADVAVVAPVLEQGEVLIQEVTEQVEAELPSQTSVDAIEVAVTDVMRGETVTEEETGMTGNAKPVAAPIQVPVADLPADIQTALVAGGCFWCVESDLEKTPGVLAAVSGYAGGNTTNPTYENYGSGGHREVVEVTYDANQISFEEILIVTMKTTDPTDDDGTFADRGDKYSAAFYYETAAQKAIIDALIAEVDQKGPYDAPLAIDIEKRPTFYEAEDFHQDYYKGTLSKLKYQFYRNASGRNDFIQKYWGDDHGPALPWRTNTTSMNTNDTYFWSNYQKPTEETLKAELDPLVYKVTQADGTERAGTSELDKNYERGIYVDVLSGEPLYSSKHKFDSGTGWPSFTQPITPDAVTEHEDRKLFSVRTETRSAIADNHLGHVFTDGPADQGGLRYCMNGAALSFIPEADMEAKGYGDFLQYL